MPTLPYGSVPADVLSYRGGRLDETLHATDGPASLMQHVKNL